MSQIFLFENKYNPRKVEVIARKTEKKLGNGKRF